MAHLLAALLLGAAFGCLVQRTHFCTMGAIADVVLFGSLRRLRTWLLAAAVAIALTQLAGVTGWTGVETSPYRATPVPWLSLVVGGAAFGFGMVLAGGCVSRNLVRLGGGSLKALVVLLLVAVGAAAILGGGLLPVRTTLGELAAVDMAASLDGIVAAATGIGGAWLGPATGVVAAAGIAAFCLADAGFRRSRRELALALGLGLLPPLFWLLATPAEAIGAAGLTYVAPMAETLTGLVGTATGVMPAVGLTTGTVLGAFVAAAVSGRLRLETFAGREDMLRNLAGGALMGIGGGLAGGCTVGHGLTGIATLGIASLLALLGMAGGAVSALRWLQTGRLLPWRLARPRREVAGAVRG
jgi:hypothetical protein